ncbi:MAG: hypothetical protein LUH47_07815, partial [Clostridiales bacterium]|nr:hypothetical protein [Clostridiales bacterium]
EEKPDGEVPEMPEREKPDGEVPEMPEGEEPDGEVPEMPEREKPDGEMTDMTFNGEEKTITVSDSIIFTETDGEKTQASLSDISEGTVIMITYDEDGTTPTEIIIRK